MIHREDGLEELPAEAREALGVLAGVEPPLPPAARVRAGVHRSVRRRRAARRIAIAASGVAGAAAAVWIAVSLPLTGETPGPAAAGPPVGTVVVASDARQAALPIGAGDTVARGRLAVGKEGHVELRLESADAAVDGPAELVLDEHRITVASGAGSVRGRIVLEGCGCEAEVDGEARFEAFTRYLQIVVVAGTVETRGPATACRIIHLEAPVAAEPVVLGEIEVDAVPTETAPPTRRRRGRCDLGAQAEAYRAAVRQRGVDDAAVLRDLRTIRRQWPRCPLSHEVDLAVIDTLLSIGREGEARREARAFLRRYPRSARRSAIEPIAGR